MKLIESKFNNFRCFNKYPIRYGTDTTVFIGKNGTGKSSVLSGIRRGLSFMFAKPKEFPKNLAISNNAKVRSYRKNEANFDSLNRVYNYPIDNNFTASFLGNQLNWSMVKNTLNGGYATTKYKNALSEVLSYYNHDLLAELPVLAVFTDSFPHQEVNFGAKAKKMVSYDILPRDLGYYGWDDRTNCVELWLTRYKKISSSRKELNVDIEEIKEQIFFFEKRIDNKDKHDKNEVPDWEKKIISLKENLNFLLKDDRKGSDFLKEKNYIDRKLLDFTKPISDNLNFINKEFELYRISVSKNELSFSFKDERVISFDTLPMGYKRMFSLVIDLAYRSYIINQGKESHGVVLIDEIELHLHPTLQQEILQRLKIGFPNIQFIVTTHSPLVISNFKVDANNKIIKLEHEGNKYSNQEVENIYGVDYNTGLTEIMGANHRISEIDRLIDSVVILKSFGKDKEADKIYNQLIDILGDKNAFIEEEIDRRVIQNKK